MSKPRRGREKKESAMWERVADRLGLAHVPIAENLYRHALKGTLGGFPVEIKTFASSTTLRTRIAVQGEGRIPHGFELRVWGSLTTPSRRFEGQDVLTHDDRFDQRVRVRGNEVEAIAALGPRARTLLMKRVVHVLDGEVHADAKAFPDNKWFSWLDNEARALVWITESLAIDGPLPERLAENATADPNPQVQLRNLTLLQQHYAESPAALAASRTLLDARDPSLRLRAAEHLGDEGLPVVEAIALDDDLPAPVRIEALHHLGAKLPSVRLVPILERALFSSDRNLWRTAVEILGGVRDRWAVPMLVELGDRGMDEELVVLAAVLGQIGDAAAEPALLGWLERDSVPARIAIARALGEVGTIAAVEPLLSLTKGVLADGDLKRAARDAIERIQGRLGEVEEGRLSLADSTGQDGALSIATEGGALSLSQDATPLPARPSSSRTPSVVESVHFDSIPRSRSKIEESE